MELKKAWSQCIISYSVQEHDLVKTDLERYRTQSTTLAHVIIKVSRRPEAAVGSKTIPVLCSPVRVGPGAADMSWTHHQHITSTLTSRPLPSY